MTSERLFNSFIPQKNFYTPQNKFLDTPLMKMFNAAVLTSTSQKWNLVQTLNTGAKFHENWTYSLVVFEKSQQM